MKLYDIYKPIDGEQEHIGSINASTPKNAVRRYSFSAGMQCGDWSGVIKSRYTAKLSKLNKKNPQF